MNKIITTKLNENALQTYLGYLAFDVFEWFVDEVFVYRMSERHQIDDAADTPDIRIGSNTTVEHLQRIKDEKNMMEIN